MPSLSLGRPAALLLTLATALAARAELPLVAKARAYLGTEAALNAVKTVHYVGSMLAPNPKDPAKPVSVGIDIIFEAPYRQRTIRTSDNLIDTSALDNYDGWHRLQNAKDPSRWNLQLLPAGQIQRQRAIVWENLAFYRGLEREGGQLLDQGDVPLDGITCRKLAFIHPGDIIFYRYFDPASGRLVLTVTEDGSSIREEGEIMAGGIRFPKRIINLVKGPGGKMQTITIIFDQITVNETFPDSVFAIPALLGK